MFQESPLFRSNRKRTEVLRVGSLQNLRQRERLISTRSPPGLLSLCHRAPLCHHHKNELCSCQSRKQKGILFLLLVSLRAKSRTGHFSFIQPFKRLHVPYVLYAVFFHRILWYKRSIVTLSIKFNSCDLSLELQPTLCAPTRRHNDHWLEGPADGYFSRYNLV